MLYLCESQSKSIHDSGKLFFLKSVGICYTLMEELMQRSYKQWITMK